MVGHVGDCNRGRLFIAIEEEAIHWKRGRGEAKGLESERILGEGSSRNRKENRGKELDRPENVA